MRTLLTGIIAGHSFVTIAYAAIGPNAAIYLKNKFIQPDGFNRSAVLVGATETSVSFPGPLIRGFKGNTFRLNVVDQLTDANMLMSTSIHWHGIAQKGSSWADGTAGITQCPIAPGHSFEYQFTVPDQAGTFWYHSHYSTQYCDGLRGPMVVYDPQDPHRFRYDIDDESTVITLADWYHDRSPVVGAKSVPVPPDSILINGKGRSANGPKSALAVITVVPLLRYRFRLISTSCDPYFTFGIDGHSMTIIEVDGSNVQPLTVDTIQIFAGQRYSFILHANQGISNYWIRSLPNRGPQGFTNGINSAILRYIGAPALEPQSVASPSTRPLIEANLRPLVRAPAPGPPKLGSADVNINLDVGFDHKSGMFTMNNASFVAPSVPVLLQVMSGVQAVQDLLPSGLIYELPSNKVVELTIPGGSIGTPHPMHLHGHSFSVIRSAGSTIYNYDNPVVRDVVNIGVVGDNVTIRFETDNSGPWVLHCHIDWHLDRGMAVVMAESDPKSWIKNPPAAWNELCDIFDALPPQRFH